MTDERDFDRLARAWLELSPDRAPERSVAAVLQAVETTPQVRPWSRWLRGRNFHMSRLPLVATAAVVGVVAAGGLLLVNRPNQGVAAPSASPSPTESPSGSVRPDPLPTALRGGWVAPSRGTPVEEPDITTIVLGGSAMDRFAPEFSIDIPGRTRRLGSNVVAPEPDVLRFTLSTPGSADCGLRDVGHYRWSVSEDGQWLTFELIDDACQVRADILAGTWQRNLGFRNEGGPGVATGFKPYMTFTLPTAQFTGREYADADTLVADSDDATLKVWKDLDGFVDPCDIDKGRLDLEPGMDGFLAYLNEDPRFTVVRQEESTIDGHRAVEVEFRIGDDLVAPCWAFDGNDLDRTGVLTWMPHVVSGGFWNAEIGSRDTLLVTEVDGAMLVFETGVVENGLFSVDQTIVDSIRFLDALPTPP
jgi:hypothetical protein